MIRTQHITRFVLLLFGAAMWVNPACVAADKPPHIVLILADDMGYGDLKAYNPQSKIPTPHLDRMAAAGMTFIDAHAGGATCKPSRYSLMTGRFALRAASLNDRQGPSIPKGMPTIASLLKNSGYATAMVGKWHLGFEQKAKQKTANGFAFDYNQPLVGGPADRGFDSYFGMHASLDIPPYFYIRDRTPTKAPTDHVPACSSVGGPEGWNPIQGAFWREGPVAPDFKHIEVTPRFTSEAVKVIETHGTKKSGKPLFLYLALPSPHTPWLPTKEFVGKSGAGMYGDFTMQVDSVVGRVLGALDKADMTDNTLVIFSSDNGPVWYAKDIEKFGHASVGPLRGIKASAWEGGHRVPFIVRWPARIKAGAVNRHTIAFADVFATFAALVGQKVAPGAAVDSVSFLDQLLGQAVKGQQRPPILHDKKVIRDGKWKLILEGVGRGFDADRKKKYPTELFNLDDDLSETKNLAPSEPRRVEKLKEKMKAIVNRS